MNIENILNNYYDTYDEDIRLKKDHVHELEFITTTKYIDSFLKSGDKILEIGAGTGAYSLFYANKGYNVTSIELVQNNIDILKSKITKKMDINVIKGNATDLRMFEDNTFDMTLVLGPMYHLFDELDREKAINEAIRVTKKGGHILVAYILADLTILDWGFIKGNIYNNVGGMVTPDYKVVNKEEYIFYINYYEDIKKKLKSIKDIKLLKMVATDGVGRLMKDHINNMNNDEYKHYINYHLSTCEREDLIGYSGHILSILKKK
jgi:ubiquinone/menaquinone biosynthesis C-methylase UbiE